MNPKSPLVRVWTVASILSLLLALVPMGLVGVRPVAAATAVFVNEIHYDNAGTDAGEAIEIAGPAGTDLTGWSIVLYNGSGGAVYNTTTLSGVIPDQQSGYGTVFVSYPSNGLQNGSPDGLALVDASDFVVQFLSYEGTFVAVGGPADGMTSVDIGVSEAGGDPASMSLQLAGTGAMDDDFTWQAPAAATFGDPNIGQTFEAREPTPTPAPTEPPAESASLVINEIDYDQADTDTAEFIEIKNTGDNPVDLSTIQLALVNGTGGGAAIYQTIALPEISLAAGDYYVVCANAATVPNCDLDVTPDTNLIQNGAPDAVGLVENGNLIDAVSYEGDTGAPYTEGSGTGLEDDPDVDLAGISRFPDGVDSGVNNLDLSLRCSTPGEANASAVSDCATTRPPEVAISEVRIDQPGTDNDEYFEIAGSAGTSLDGVTYLVIGDGAGGSGVIENVTDLTGSSIPGSGFLVAAETTFSLGVSQLTTDLNFENSDNVTHLLVFGFSGTDGQDLDTDDDGVLDVAPWSDLIDLIALVEEPNPPTGTEYHYGPPAVGPDGSFVPGHAFVCGDGWRIGAFSGGQDTPGSANECAITPVKIHAVQGAGLASPHVGNTVVVEGIVVGDFQDGASGVHGDLNGFYVQEEDADADADPLTSEGVFVFDGNSPATDVQPGDLVRVEGVVSEFNGLTEITSFSGVTVLGSGFPLPTAATPSLPVGSLDDFEAYEGMLVTLPQPLFISEYFNFDRFGEIVLSTERQFQPTAIEEPGSPEAAAVAAANTLGRITLDDGRGSQNPNPAIHPNGGVFDLGNLFRGGDRVENVTGVLDYSFGLYRIQPTQGADYFVENPRRSGPDDVGGGLTVASFNVLNYFTTLDDGVNDICGPAGDQECRGADDTEELERQRDKIIAALVGMDADVVGLIEIQNDAFESTADLVAGLNDALGAGTYAYIGTGFIGTDAIKQAFIYQTASATPIGPFALLDTSVDPRFNDEKNRPALAQTFQDNDTGGVVTVVVNHLKSKGSSCDDVGDPDTGDGSGNCNLTRKGAAQALVDWLATDPTDSGSPDFLIVGDLNSYDKEDPIDAILAGADDTVATSDDWTDLVQFYQGEYAYSYVFDGQLGYLDHGLASAEMASKVTGTTIWHINADEPDLLDYDTTFKKDAQDALYEPNAYRSSDHDPVIVGLNVCEMTPPTLTVELSPNDLWPANHKYVDVTAAVTALDNWDPNPQVVLLSVTSSEPDNGLGDGDTPNDIVIVDDFHFRLRAERSGGGEGRFYTVTYQATDSCGNSTVASGVVTVPKSQGKK